jgi:EF hand
MFSSSDDRLSLAEFSLICRALFRNDKGHIYRVPVDRLEQMFAVFDKNEDGYIDRDEFQFCWNQWIKTVSLGGFGGRKDVWINGLNLDTDIHCTMADADSFQKIQIWV